uniref:SKP1 component POZ domain-containing protein n=1 Tax=Anopheles dirus TaxID=7168 RepID=A0A182NQH5_9DIPT
MESVKLKSNDGEIIVAKRSIINQSSVLQKKLEELEAAGEKHGEQFLSIPEADGNCLRKIIQWMDNQKETPPSQTVEKDSEDDAIPNNQEQLIEQNNSAGLLQQLNAAHRNMAGILFLSQSHACPWNVNVSYIHRGGMCNIQFLDE